MNLNETELIIIQHLSKSGGTGNVMEFLDFRVTDFDKVFSIANEMQNKDLLKLLYSNFNNNQIVVEMTLIGYKASRVNIQ